MSSLQVVGRYTSPHTWGVYRIEPEKASSTKRFRKGNHPVRRRELTREYPAGPVKMIALYTQEALAIELMELLNADAGAAAHV